MIPLELMKWLQGRRPAAPSAFEPWLVGLTAREEESPAEALLRLGRESLGEAHARPGRHRESAYHLLAADALITYACEAAAEGADVEEDLRGILRGTGGRLD